jgi:predicted DNA-binding transcriptional regulator AlpA
MYSAIPPTGFLRLKQVLALVPISKSSWWEGCKEGRFPKPVKLGPRTTAWKAEDIAALVKSLGAQEAGKHDSKMN